MSDSDPFQPTHTQVPPAAEPATLSAVTHSQTGEPQTASIPAASTPQSEVVPFLPGFDILRELGRGGMGVVYEARQTRLNRSVALKVLRGARGETRDVVRFLTEAEAVAAVRHRHVVQVFEFGQDAGQPFMALELLTGGTLAERLKARGRLEARDAVQLVAELADAVQTAHDLGIIHRDLKPGNILFDDRGVAKITDFGLAKRTGGVDLTQTQAVMGTPAYMAPEQARGETKFVGPAADVWALGAILYECLTGKRPFDADDTWAILRKVTDEAPPRPRTHFPGLPRDLELIALKCLEKRPADRYPSAAALADDLHRFLAGRPVSIRPAGPIERGLKWVRRNPGVAGATAAVALALVVGSAVSLAFGLQARKRGEELAKANGDLIRTNDDLGKANDDLTSARNAQEATNEVLKNAQADLFKRANDLIDSQNTAEERGYLSDVALAHQLWKANDLLGMHATLARCPPERRQWEWHYLDGLARPNRQTIPTASPPLALAYSPDGKYLAFLTISSTLELHVLETGKVSSFSVEVAAGRNRALAFRPDSKELAFAIGSQAWVASIPDWKLTELVPKKGSAGASAPLNYVALGYTHAGKLLGAAEGKMPKRKNTSFQIRDIVGDNVVAILDAWESPPEIITEVAGAAFSPDGKRFAVAGVDIGVRISKAGETTKFVPFTPTLLVWDIESKKRLDSTVAGSSVLGSIAFSPDGKAIGFGRRGQTVEYTPDSVNKLLQMPGHTGEVLAVAFDSTNNLIWSGGEEKLIRAHNRNTSDERFVLRGCPQAVLRMAVSPDGKEVAAAVGELTGGGGAILRFDMEALVADSWHAPAGRQRVSLVTALSTDGARFAACSFDLASEQPHTARFVIREGTNGKERVVTPSGRWFRGVFRPDGSLVALTKNNQLTVIGTDGKCGKEIALPESNPGGIWPAMAYSADGRMLATVSSTGIKTSPQALHATISTWNGDGYKPGPTAEIDLSAVRPPKAKSSMITPTSAAFDRTGTLLAMTFLARWQESDGRDRIGFSGVLIVWDIASAKEIFRRVRSDELNAVAFDPNGRVVAAGGTASGGAVFGWDIATGKEELTLTGHTRPILALAFGPNGRLATGGRDRTVKVWDVANRREMLTLDGFAREVTHLAFTSDGRDLVAATGIDLMGAMMAPGIPTEFPRAEVRVFHGSKITAPPGQR